MKVDSGRTHLASHSPYQNSPFLLPPAAWPYRRMPMDHEADAIRQQMEETRASLTEKLETLEQQIVETVQGATSAVTETVENVKEAVHETVSEVKEKVHETVDTVKLTFDLRQQVDRYPWLLVGGAA